MLNNIEPQFYDLIGYPVPGPEIEPGSLQLAPRFEKLAGLLARGVPRTEAAQQCGWKSPSPCNRSEVVERSGYLARELWRAEHMGPDELLAHVAAVVRFDPAKLVDGSDNPLAIGSIDPATRKAIQGVEFEERVDEDGNTTRRVKFKASDKAAAQDKLMRRFGLYERDNAQVSTGRTLIALLGAVQEESRGVGELFDALPEG